MSNERKESEIKDAQDIDPGEPISALEGLEHNVSIHFVNRIRLTVQRRTTLNQLVSFLLSIPLVVLRELWSVLRTRPNPKGPGKDPNDGEETS
jgi:hypothetical protein